MKTYEVAVEVRYTERVTIELTEEQGHSKEEVLRLAVEAAGLQDAPKSAVSLYYSRDITPPKRTVKERINAAFKAMRKHGIVARMNYQCCSSCGWAALEIDYPKFDDDNDTAVFYHRQDAESFDERGNLRTGKYWNSHNELVERTIDLYLAWMGDGETIVHFLQAQGLTVKWDGSSNTRIAVTGVKEDVA